MPVTKPQDRRPPARKHTAGSQKRREEALSQGYRLTIEGEVYEAQLGDVTPQIARDLRKVTGFGFLGLMRAMATDADVDLISAAVWVARRVAGEQIALEEVEVTYAAMLGDDFEVAVAESDKVDPPDPEA
jgi:selenophosphate synthase